jgi:hypothetical protein
VTRIEQAVTFILAVALVCLGAAECAAATVWRGDGAAVSRSVVGPEPGTVRRDLDLELTLDRDGQQAPLRTGEDALMRYAVVEVPAAGEAKVSAAGEFNWTDATAMGFYARLDAGSTGLVQFVFFFQDVDFWWFQKLLRAEVSSDGAWTKISVPLVAEPADAGTKYAWQSMGHSKPYDRNALRKARRVGLIVVPAAGRAADAGPARVLLANAHLVLDAEPAQEAPRFYDLVSPPSVRRYERFEAAFQLDRTYANPFDPDVVDVQADVTMPSGATVAVAGFWYQNYRRRIVGRAEQLVPVGEPSWRVRFAPTEVGTHTYTITVRDAAGTRTTAPRRFEVLDGPSDGFLRVSTSDYHYFEFDSGRPWWGIGLNLHGMYDYRYNTMVRGSERILEMDRYSLFYDDRLGKCARNGINWTELWIASWGFEIEWRGDWRGWAGTGHYNLENAWRLDRALEQCRDYGIYVNLVLSCHGAYSRVRGQQQTFDDSEFQHHAYYKGNGGWLSTGQQILTDARAREAMRKRLRYLIARYAYSTNIACWEMISESDLVEGGRSAALPFVFKMAEMVRGMDPYAHPITNHYCGHYFNVDRNCATDPRMDLIAGDAYRGGDTQRRPDGNHWRMYFEPMAATVVSAAKFFESFRKPAIITESGGEWFAGPRPLLEADIHSGNWGAWMTSLPTTPLTWWEDLVDEDDLYGDYAAFARYAAGEDKRNRGLETSQMPTLDAAGKPIPGLTTLTLKNRTGGYAWIYDETFFEFGTTKIDFPRYGGGSGYFAIFCLEREVPIRWFARAFAVIGDLDPGVYDVEVWDCYEGRIVSRAETECDSSGLVVPLPAFSRDVALKFNKRPY